MSVDEVFNEYLQQFVDIVENGSSEKDEVSDEAISLPSLNEFGEPIEILNRSTLFTSDLDLDLSESLKQNKSKKIGKNEQPSISV